MYTALQRQAKERGRAAEELLTLYALERFLARLVAHARFDDQLADVIAFVDPLYSGAVGRQAVWNPDRYTWTEPAAATDVGIGR